MSQIFISKHRLFLQVRQQLQPFLPKLTILTRDNFDECVERLVKVILFKLNFQRYIL